MRGRFGVSGGWSWVGWMVDFRGWKERMRCGGGKVRSEMMMHAVGHHVCRSGQKKKNEKQNHGGSR